MLSGKDAKGRFLPGNSGGGRPKGARSKLSEEFLAAMLADFQVNGVATIAAVRNEKPEAYLRVIASLLPKEIVGEVAHHSFVARMPEPCATTEEWLERYAPKPKLS
jgi:hypothetical protein